MRMGVMPARQVFRLLRVPEVLAIKIFTNFRGCDETVVDEATQAYGHTHQTSGHFYAGPLRARHGAVETRSPARPRVSANLAASSPATVMPFSNSPERQRSTAVSRCTHASSISTSSCTPT